MRPQESALVFSAAPRAVLHRARLLPLLHGATVDPCSMRPWAGAAPATARLSPCWSGAMLRLASFLRRRDGTPEVTWAPLVSVARGAARASRRRTPAASAVRAFQASVA